MQMQKKNIQIGEYTVGISQVIDAFDKIGKGYSEMEKKIRLPKSLLADFEEISKKLALLSNSRPGKNANLKQLEKYRKDIDSIVGRMNEFQKKLSNIKIDDKNIKNYSKETEELNKKLKEQIELRKQYEDKITKGNKVKPTQRVGYLDEKTETFRSTSIEEIRKNGIESKQIIIDKARKLRTQAQTELDRRKGLNYKDPVYGAQQIEQAQSRVTNITQIERSLLAIADQMDILVQKEKAIRQEFEQATQAERNFLQQDFSKLPNEVGEVSNELKALLHTQEQYNVAAQEQEERLQKFNSFKSYIAGIFSIGTAWQQTTRIVRNAVQDFLELDKQFNEIAIVSQYSTQELWKTFGQVNKTAQEYGVTTKNVVEVQNLYYHQGKNINQVNKLTAQTLTLAKITGMDYARATSDLTAALNGYKIAAEDANKVTDSIAALDANAAISSEELMTALTKTASIAANAGMSLQSTEVFLTKMIETTREAPENLGTAMKTIIARFGEVKEEIDGEQIELADINKVDTALKSIGITLLDTAGQIRNLDDVFFELSAKWDSLDRNTQRYIATQAAGSRQQSRFIAMMDDYDRTLELVDIAQNSAGTGARQLQKAQEGLESKINSLKSAWQELYSSVITSSAIGGVLNIANNFLNILNTIPGPFGALVGVLSLYGIKVAVVDKLMNSLGESFAKSTGAMEASKQQMILQISTMSEEEKALALKNKELGENTRKLIKNTAAKKDNNAVRNTSTLLDSNGNRKKIKAKVVKEKTFKEIFSESWKKEKDKRTKFTHDGTHNSIVSTAKNTKEVASKGIKKVNTKLSSGIKALGSSLATSLAPVIEFATTFAPLLGIAAAVVAGYLTYTKLIRASVNDTKSLEKLSKAQEDYNSSLSNYKDLTKNIQTAEKYRDRTNLTEQERQEEQTAIQNIIDKYPNLLDYVDEEGNYHLKNTTAINQEVKAQKELLKVKTDAYANLRLTQRKTGIYADENTLAGASIKNLQNYYSSLDKDNLKKIAKDIDSVGGFNKSVFYDFAKAYASGEKSSFGYKDFSNLFSGQVTESEFQIIAKTFAKQLESGSSTQEAFQQAVEKSRKSIEKLVPVWEKLNEATGNLYNNLLQGIGQEISSIYVQKAQVITSTSDFSTDISKEIITNLIGKELENIYDEESNKKRIEEIRNKRNESFSNRTADALTRNNSNTNIVLQDQDYALAQAEVALQNKKAEKETVNFWENALKDEELKKKIETFSGKIGTLTEINQKSIQSLLETSGLNSDSEIYQRADKISDAIKKIYSETLEFSDKLTGNYKSLYNTSTIDTKTRIKDIYAELGDSAANKFLDGYIELQKNLQQAGKNEQEQKDILQNYLNTNIKQKESIDKALQKIKKLSGEEAAETAFQAMVKAGGDAAYSFTDLTNSAENLQSSFESLSKNIQGALNLLEGKGTLTDVANWLSSQTETWTTENFTDEAIKNLVKGITYTNDGIQATSGTSEQITSQITALQDSVYYNMRVVQGKIDALRGKGTLTDIETAQLQDLSLQLGELRVAWGNIGAEQKRINHDKVIEGLQKAKEKADKYADSLKNLVTWLREYDRYANLDRVIEDWENQKGHLEFEVDFTLNEDVIKKDLEKQLNVINNEIAANQGGIKAAKEDAAMWKSVIQSRNSGYVSFDSNGNAIVDAKKLKQLQEKISKADEYHKESLQAQYDEIMDNVDAYQNAIDKVEDYTSALEDNFKALQDLLNKAYESIKTVEDKLIDVRQDQEDRQLKAVKDKYDAIKEEDNKYLESVRKTIEKERQIRDREDNDNDIRKKERKLAMMKMDTSGVYRNEIQALEEELKGDYRSREDTFIDQKIDEMEEQFSKEQENRDKELTYWDNYYAALRDQRTEYNAWAKQMIESGSDEILAYLKANDQEYLASSEAGKQIWTQQWQQATVAAVAYNGMISTTLNVVQMNLDMCAGSANGFEGAVQSYSSTAIAQNGAVSSTVQDLTGYYQGLAGGVGEVSGALSGLQTAYTNAAGAAERLAAAEAATSFGRAFLGDIPGIVPSNNPANNSANNEPMQRVLKNNGNYNNTNAGAGWKVIESAQNKYLDINGNPVNTIDQAEYIRVVSKNENFDDLPRYVRKDRVKQSNNKIQNNSALYYRRYATGGYVDYTGPAWVDGTKAKPEYMLNSTQTAQFEKLVSILDSIFIKTPNYSTHNIPSQETSKEAIFNFNIDVQKMSDDYDVDQLINRIQKKLSEIDKYKKVTFLRKTN